MPRIKNLTPNQALLHSRLRISYCVLVTLSSMFIFWQAYNHDGELNTYLDQWWLPSIPFVMLLSLAVISLCLVAWKPIWAICVYVLVEHSTHRYGAEMGYIFTYGLPEWIAGLGAVGAAVWLLRNPPNIDTGSSILAPAFMLILFLWAIASTLHSVFYLEIDTFEIKHHPARYLNGLLLFYVSCLCIRKLKDIYAIAVALTIAIILRSVLYDGLYLDGDTGHLIAILIPLLLLVAATVPRRLLKAVFYCLACGFFISIILIQSRGAAVATIVSLAIVVLVSPYRRRFFIFALPVVALTVGGTYLSGFSERIKESVPGGNTYSSIESRLTYWGYAIDMSKDHLLIGVGPGNYASAMSAYNASNSSGRAAHSSFLSVLAELGIVGFLVYLALIISCISPLLSLTRNADHQLGLAAGCIVAAISAHMASGMFLSRHDQGLLFILLGTGAALTLRRDKSKLPLP